jgi:integrase
MFLQGLGLPRIRFHDLRATWCTLMLQNGIEPIKVMKMGGWKNIATMEIYIRKAGVDIGGITNSFELHNHSTEGKVLHLGEIT